MVSIPKYIHFEEILIQISPKLVNTVKMNTVRIGAHITPDNLDNIFRLYKIGNGRRSCKVIAAYFP